MVNSFGEPIYIYCATVIPWATYTSLNFEKNKSFKNLIFGAAPPIFGLLGGYLPLAAACLLFSIILNTTYFITNSNDNIRSKIIARIIYSLLPLFLASIIISPYLLAVYNFLKESPSSKTSSLFYSAHQLAELPQTLIRMLSPNLQSPGPFYEFSSYLGFSTITIASIFFFNENTRNSIKNNDWIILKIFLTIYFIINLATYGQYSFISDFIYYFIPQIGGMHIYQRFYLPAYILIAYCLLVMMSAIINERPVRSIKYFTAIFFLLSIFGAYYTSQYPESSTKFGINNFVVIELFTTFLFCLSLLFPGKIFPLTVSIIVILFPALNRMYDYSSGGNIYSEKVNIQPLEINEDVKANIVNYLKKYPKKDVYKYVDLTPMWNEKGTSNFPKSFPYFVINDINLSSYHGFNFYLSSQATYMSQMPVLGKYEIQPNWDWINLSGADFIVLLKKDLIKNQIKSIADLNHSNMLFLPNDIVIAPILKKSDSKILFDNGFFQIKPKEIIYDYKNLALNKPTKQSTTAGNAFSKLSVDGIKDGNFANNSTTHTQNQPNAWLEIDLETINNIDQIKIWNRTDCCQDRLNNFWVFISDQPFLDTDTSSILRKRKNTLSYQGFTPVVSINIQVNGSTGRYIRIQLDDSNNSTENILSIAEIEVNQKIPTTEDYKSELDFSKDQYLHHSNNANYQKLIVNSRHDLDVNYLMWGNPRQNFYLNGALLDKSDPKILGNIIKLKSGLNTIEVKYFNKLLFIFWIFYFTFFAILSCFLIFNMYVRFKKSTSSNF